MGMSAEIETGSWLAQHAPWIVPLFAAFAGVWFKVRSTAATERTRQARVIAQAFEDRDKAINLLNQKLERDVDVLHRRLDENREHLHAQRAELSETIGKLEAIHAELRSLVSSLVTMMRR